MYCIYFIHDAEFYTHSSSIMTPFISIYIVLGTACVNLLSAVREFNVSGPVGSTAILPCNLSVVETKTQNIRWIIKSSPQEDKSKIVFERLGEEAEHGEGYEGRVDVPVEELRKRNCSLVLHNLTLTDTGVYTSYLPNTQTKRDLSVTKEIGHVHLTVSAEERSHKNTDSSDNGGRNHHYLWLLVLPGLGLLGLGVWGLKRRNNTSQL